MPSAPAPLLEDIADGPPGGAAYWARTGDDRRIRLAHWPARPGGTVRGTVLLFPGRTEYIEKYGPTAGVLTAAGYDVVAVDWRGQGLADRLTGNEKAGHVRDFADYQLDSDAMLALARDLALPQPWHLLAHSMGGCIALRALMRGLPVVSAAFTAPMWGIAMSRLMRPAAWALSCASTLAGRGHVIAPGTGADAYVAIAPFDDNLLTADRETFDWLRRQVDLHPELRIAGPTFRWLRAALVETRALARMPAPDLPCRVWLGGNERIVDVPRIEARIAGWRGAALEVMPGAQHEVLMERKAVRDHVRAGLIAHFAAHGTG